MGVAQDSIRKCNGPCGETKQLVAFATYRSRSGELRRRGICKECRDGQNTATDEDRKEYRRNYNRSSASKRHAEQRVRRSAAKAYVDEYKTSNPCVDCGRYFPAVAMDFDHVRGAKARAVSGLVSGAYKLDLIKAEIEKCDLVCACCHRVRTAKRGDNLARPKTKLAISVKYADLAVSRLITHNGETLSVSEWSRRLGIRKATIAYRLKVGYAVEQALSTKTYSASGASPVATRRVGVNCANSKLNDKAVRAIRADLKAGKSQTAVAKKYGVSQGAISAILRGRTWSHVK
jgi:hypothetical protein